jgi:hypothetical protein
MFSKLSSRFTYANVMATIAVFLALGGGAYAAVTLPKNSVGAKQIKANAISSPKVKDGSLQTRDFATGQFSALVARPHTTASFQTVSGSSAMLPPPPNVTLTGNSWTQQPGEVDYITGQANVTAPASCPGSGTAGFMGSLYLDGTSIAYPSPSPNLNLFDTYEASSTYDVRDFFDALGRHNTTSLLALSNVLVLPGPVAATHHTLTAGVIDVCSGGNHYTVNALEIEVASAH